MKLTDREKVVLILAPVAVILGGYAWWFNLFHRQKVQEAQRAYDAAVAVQVRPTDLLQQKGRSIKLQREVDDLQRQESLLKAEAAAVCGRSADPLRRIDAERQLTELLRRHQLQLMDEAPAGKEGEAKLPGSLAEALGRFAEQGSRDGGGQVRRVRLTGRFLDLLAAMEELAKTDNPPGIPIRLTMADADADGQQRSWTLLVWM